MTSFTSDPAITIVRGACPHDCPDTCAMLIKVQDGRAISVAGDPDHPVTQGFLCAKVSRYLERTYHADRILHPMRRVGPRGSGQWERITWDEALDTIAARFQSISAEYGPQAILPYSYSGTMGCQFMARRWTGASSTGSAPRSSTARSARRPARPATR